MTLHPISIRSGGQTGVDRAALDIAVARHISYEGWCPQGGWAEDYPNPPGLLARYPGLMETPSVVPQQRTAWNVRESDATLFVVKGNGFEISPGTGFTRTCAELIFQCPTHIADLDSPDALDRASKWLIEELRTTCALPFVLNIAGPRESESPGIYSATFLFLSELIDRITVGAVPAV